MEAIGKIASVNIGKSIKNKRELDFVSHDAP